MANTYTQLYFHIVFAVKGRSNLISNGFQEELYKYISGIVANKNQKVLAINGMPNHIHLLISMKPDFNLSDLINSILTLETNPPGRVLENLHNLSWDAQGEKLNSAYKTINI